MARLPVHRRRAAALAVLSIAFLAGCGGPPLGPVPSPSPTGGAEPLPFVGPYRGNSDACQLTGESDFTNTFLDDSADLVSCPTGSADAGTLIIETGAVEVAEAGEFTLYSVPRG